jgi:uncharacterized protein
MDAGLEVVYEPERQRYELREGDRTIGYADAVPRGEAIAMPYVQIVPELRGREFGALLLRGTLDDLKRQGKRVIPICPYVSAFIRRNPEYRELVASDEGRGAIGS